MRLIVVRGPKAVDPLVLGELPAIVGRDEGADLCLPSKRVSRRHCEVVVDGDRVRFRDLGSQNLLVDQGGHKARVLALGPGERVQVGDYLIEVDPSQEPRERTETLELDPEDVPDDLVLEDDFLETDESDPSELPAGVVPSPTASAIIPTRALANVRISHRKGGSRPMDRPVDLDAPTPTAPRSVPLPPPPPSNLRPVVPRTSGPPPRPGGATSPPQVARRSLAVPSGARSIPPTRPDGPILRPLAAAPQPNLPAPRPIQERVPPPRPAPPPARELAQRAAAMESVPEAPTPRPAPAPARPPAPPPVATRTPSPAPPAPRPVANQGLDEIDPGFVRPEPRRPRRDDGDTPLARPRPTLAAPAAVSGPAPYASGVPWLLQGVAVLFLALGLVVCAPFGGTLALVRDGIDGWDAAALARAEQAADAVAVRNRDALAGTAGARLDACCTTERASLGTVALLDPKGVVVAPSDRVGISLPDAALLDKAQRARAPVHSDGSGDVDVVTPVIGGAGNVLGYAWVSYDPAASRPPTANPWVRALAGMFVVGLSGLVLIVGAWWLLAFPIGALRDQAELLAFGEGSALSPTVRWRPMELLVHAINRTLAARGSGGPRHG